MPKRLDISLVEQGICASRSRAQALIKAGVVTVNGAVARKASLVIADGDNLALTHDPLRYVSRAALKLVAGLDHFEPEIAGKTALDLGASTGGFCEVLLERGAARVLAVDVGHGQLAPTIAKDPRVTAFEGMNARDLAKASLPAFQIITADLSFISLKIALPPALKLAPVGSVLIALIKPQFEVGRDKVGKGGIVRDEASRQAACEDISGFLYAQGWAVNGVIDSPIEGSDGNKEFLIGARKEGSTTAPSSAN